MKKFWINAICLILVFGLAFMWLDTKVFAFDNSANTIKITKLGISNQSLLPVNMQNQFQTARILLQGIAIANPVSNLCLAASNKYIMAHNSHPITFAPSFLHNYDLLQNGDLLQIFSAGITCNYLLYETDYVLVQSNNDTLEKDYNLAINYTNSNTVTIQTCHKNKPNTRVLLRFVAV